MWNFAAFFLDCFVDLIEKSEIILLLLIKVLVLITSLLRVLKQDVAINRVMEHKLIDNILGLEASILERELGQIVWCLWIVRIQHLEDHLFFLLLGEILLVHSWNVVCTHVEKIVVFLDVFVLLIDVWSSDVLLSLDFSSSFWHWFSCFENLNYKRFVFTT